MKKLKNWFFKNLAVEILKLKPEYSVENKRTPIAAFESQDLFLDKQKEEEAKTQWGVITENSTATNV